MTTRKPSILIVEDDALLAQAMKEKFTQVGFMVEIAKDGILAMQALKSKIPQVVLLDILLPKKNGFDILAEMKTNAIWKQIPVVIASNLESDKDMERGYSLGAGDYIVKSNLSLNDLVQKVTFLMNMSNHGKKFLAGL